MAETPNVAYRPPYLRDDTNKVPRENRPNICNEWVEITHVEWVGTRNQYDQWNLWGKFRELEFRLTAYPEHRRAIKEAGYSVDGWPDSLKRGKRIKIPRADVLVCWANGIGLSFKEVQPAAAGVGD